MNLQDIVEKEFEQMRENNKQLQEYLRTLEKPSKELTEDFKKVLDNEKNNENDIQKYMELHSELIPLPILEGHQLHNSVIISKLQINQGLISDFAYLTKCSDCWRLVLIELEDSKKNIFLKDSSDIKFSAQFNHAYSQILSWKAYLDENKNILKQRLLKLMMPAPMRNLPFKISYVLVIGRNSEKEKSERRTAMFYQQNRDDIFVKTYDSIISEYLNRGTPIHKIILSPWKEDGFKIKSVPGKEIETWLFSEMTPDDLDVNETAKKALKDQGYCIDRWLDGFMLTEDGKYDKQTKINMLSKESMARRILENEL